MYQRAVVIGGGIAGLCSARVLSKQFRQVVIVERDKLSSGAARAGTPQSRHPHIFLGPFRNNLEQLFEGFDREMLDQGALEYDNGLYFAQLSEDGWYPRIANGYKLMHASRGLAEATIRGRVERIPNIEVRQASVVDGLVGTSDPPRITGVTLRGGDRLDAELVVDASGTHSKILDWLAALRIPAPAETRIKASVAYSTRWYRVTRPWPAEWWWLAGCLSGAQLPRWKYNGIILPTEHNVWSVTVAGRGDERGYPPAENEAWLQAMEEHVMSPAIRQFTRFAEPVSDVRGYRHPINRLRHLDRWADRPAGLVVVGDAACLLNPAFGHSIALVTSALVELERLLARNPGDLDAAITAFYAAQWQVYASSWRMSQGVGFGRVDGDGEPVPPRLADWVGRGSDAALWAYLRLLFRATHFDPVVLQHHYGVLNLFQPVSIYWSPEILRRVLKVTAKNLLTGRTERYPSPFTPMPQARLFGDEAGHA